MQSLTAASQPSARTAGGWALACVLTLGCGGAQAKHGMRPGAVPTQANEDAGPAGRPTAEEPAREGGLLPEGLMSVTDAGGCVVHAGQVRCWRGTVHGGERQGFEGLAHFEGPRGVPGAARWVSGDASYGCAVVLQQSAGASSQQTQTGGGEVWCWGDNSAGQLGARSSASRSPRALRVVGMREAVQVAASRWHACALTRAGEVWCWGDNDSGQTGQLEDYVNELRAWVRAERVPGVERAVRVRVVESTSCALLEASAGWGTCWGEAPPAGWKPVQAPGAVWLMPELRGARDWSWWGECGCAVFEERAVCRPSQASTCGAGGPTGWQTLEGSVRRVVVGQDMVCVVPVASGRTAPGQAGVLVCRDDEGGERRVGLGGVLNFGLGQDLCLHRDAGVECIAVRDWLRRAEATRGEGVDGETSGGEATARPAAMRIVLPFDELEEPAGS